MLLPDRDKLVAERDAARADIDFILNAIEGKRFTDGLQTAEDYVRYSLGTASRLYHVEGYMDVCRERDAARAERTRWIKAFNRLEKAVTNHIRDCIDADGLAHVHKVVLRDLGPNPGALDEGGE